jgi:integrase
MRQPKPFFRKYTQSWYVKIGGKFIPLGPDESKAWEAYHAIMASRQPVTDDTPVAILIGKFLSWTEKHKKPLTYRWYKRFLTSFVESIGQSLTIGKLKTSHVTEWRDDRYGSKTAACKRGAVVSVKRALNWAADEAELIPVNPVKKIKSGKPQSREIYITPEQWQVILSAVDDSDPFKELLLVMRATGCRPQEARLVECRHVDLTKRVWEFPVNESKSGEKTGKKRLVLLNDDALDLTRRAVVRAGGDGRLFRNRKGKPFSVSWIASKCRRLATKTGIRFFLYALRHSWITDMLMLGTDVCTVAQLAGNSPEMVMNVYNQLGLNQTHLRAALAKAAIAPAGKREAS